MGLSESTSARLATQLDPLLFLFGTANPDALRRRPPSGKWSAHENLAHLGRYHEVFLERLHRMLSEDRPQLGWYRAEDDPEAANWMALPTDEVLRQDPAAFTRAVDPNRLPSRARGDDHSGVD